MNIQSVAENKLELDKLKPCEKLNFNFQNADYKRTSTSTTSNKIKKGFMEIITFNFFIKTNEDILRSYQNNGFTIMNGHIL